MRIDPHVHCRDGSESYKETMAHVFRLCDEQGVDMIFDMPNTAPPVLTEVGVEERLRLVPAGARSRYRLFVGATADPAQLRQAVALAGAHPAVVGLKMYAAPSIGSLAVATASAQQLVYRALVEFGFMGVLAVHCEKAELFKDVFDPAQPSTHGAARPPEAEIEAVREQIKFARQAGFRGTLHICHVSCAGALEIIQQAKSTAGLRLTCGVTPHHLLWSSAQSKGPAGLIYKVNPPLREPADTVALRTALKQGVIDWIESDHAPHALGEKLYPPYASGFPSLWLYRQLVEELLPAWGVNAEMISNLTGGNIRKTFGVEKTNLEE